MLKSLTRLTTGVLAAAAIGMAGSVSATAADFPTKPVEMTVLFGGTANTIAQVLSELMTDELGNPVVPVSRPGGGGAVGYAFVQGSRPDGYNIVWNSNSINTSHHTGKIPFDYTAFEPVAQVSVETPALAVSSDKGWESLSDMAEAVKAMDGTLKVGISGKGSFTHLTSAALFDWMGIGDKVSYISYGDGKAPVELLAGRIDAAIQWPGQFKSYVDTNKISVLAVTGNERVDILPDVPTASEQGVDINITMWRGLAVPKGTPKEVIAKLESAAKAATESEKFKEASVNLGFTPAYLDASAFGDRIAKDDGFYQELLTSLGMTN
ncbi:tripartite tricarboxylate transporter substrate binding protein [Notoacmeibacter sp. MSK16QG-6]|uniref:Bug family tripartite tricarboxylate transporter substrate binding protein n=1 Tax=Notoacmeibacter sp. MSK16QG-6 TaxID=2957982 RepID=UPI00209DBDAA|nr:tripartite tricarboxylate transporter substrate binding protein [Notoacmeibacter sp. MSK16QG-6]MCP1200449.1 tripartite tricarboxylate transporter substrate binding protein [Notoacmeibacter sp. MSK16QG-6]